MQQPASSSTRDTTFDDQCFLDEISEPYIHNIDTTPPEIKQKETIKHKIAITTMIVGVIIIASCVVYLLYELWILYPIMFSLTVFASLLIATGSYNLVQLKIIQTRRVGLLNVILPKDVAESIQELSGLELILDPERWQFLAKLFHGAALLPALNHLRTPEIREVVRNMPTNAIRFLFERGGVLTLIPVKWRYLLMSEADVMEEKRRILRFEKMEKEKILVKKQAFLSSELQATLRRRHTLLVDPPLQRSSSSECVDYLTDVFEQTREAMKHKTQRESSVDIHEITDDTSDGQPPGAENQIVQQLPTRLAMRMARRWAGTQMSKVYDKVVNHETLNYVLLTAYCGYALINWKRS